MVVGRGLSERGRREARPLRLGEEYVTLEVEIVFFTHRGGKMLNITNGDGAKEGIEQAGIAGGVLAWKDILHEGPVPTGLSFDEMRRVRAGFIADFVGESYETVLRDFNERDMALARFREHEEVVLWFEHDLYDQLQLLQILSWLAQEDRGATKLSLICINTFPGIADFQGLGQLAPAQLGSLFGSRQEVSEEMLSLGREAWEVYCGAEPTGLEAFIKKDSSALPFLKQALHRHLEQFPARDNGLSRTEREILEVVSAGVSTPVEIFLAEQRKEESPFMGDTTLWMHLSRLCEGTAALIKRGDDKAFALPRDQRFDDVFREQVLVPTERAAAVLGGKSDWIVMQGGIDRWLGGVHLQGESVGWRWDRVGGRLVKDALA